MTLKTIDLDDVKEEEKVKLVLGASRNQGKLFDLGFEELVSIADTIRNNYDFGSKDYKALRRGIKKANKLYDNGHWRKAYGQYRTLVKNHGSIGLETIVGNGWNSNDWANERIITHKNSRAARKRERKKQIKQKSKKFKKITGFPLGKHPRLREKLENLYDLDYIAGDEATREERREVKEVSQRMLKKYRHNRNKFYREKWGGHLRSLANGAKQLFADPKTLASKLHPRNIVQRIRETDLRSAAYRLAAPVSTAVLVYLASAAGAVAKKEIIDESMSRSLSNGKYVPRFVNQSGEYAVRFFEMEDEDISFKYAADKLFTNAMYHLFDNDGDLANKSAEVIDVYNHLANGTHPVNENLSLAEIVDLVGGSSMSLSKQSMTIWTEQKSLSWEDVELALKSYGIKNLTMDEYMRFEGDGIKGRATIRNATYSLNNRDPDDVAVISCDIYDVDNETYERINSTDEAICIAGQLLKHSQELAKDVYEDHPLLSRLVDISKEEVSELFSKVNTSAPLLALDDIVESRGTVSPVVDYFFYALEEHKDKVKPTEVAKHPGDHRYKNRHTPAISSAAGGMYSKGDSFFDEVNFDNWLEDNDLASDNLTLSEQIELVQHYLADTREYVLEEDVGGYVCVDYAIEFSQAFKHINEDEFADSAYITGYSPGWKDGELELTPHAFNVVFTTDGDSVYANLIEPQGGTAPSYLVDITPDVDSIRNDDLIEQIDDYVEHYNREPELKPGEKALIASTYASLELIALLGGFYVGQNARESEAKHKYGKELFEKTAPPLCE